VAKQSQDSATTGVNRLRRVQALLIVPAICLVWIPGGFLFYFVFFILTAALALELMIQSRSQR
jgi:hypothetical protein